MVFRPFRVSCTGISIALEQRSFPDQAYALTHLTSHDRKQDTGIKQRQLQLKHFGVKESRFVYHAVIHMIGLSISPIEPVLFSLYMKANIGR